MMKMNTKNLGMLALLIVLVIGVVSISGCVAPKEKRKVEPTPTPPTTTPTPKPPSGETLGEILGKTAGIASVKYDVVMTSPGMPPTTQKVWIQNYMKIQNSKMRMEMSMQGITTVVLIDQDANIAYSYIPAQNIAIKMDLSKAPKPAIEEREDILKHDPRTIGTETLDGKVCVVVEYADGQTTTKMWIWKDRGLPLKLEMTAPEGKTTIAYKNYDFSDIPDSMFKLPSGVQIM